MFLGSKCNGLRNQQKIGKYVDFKYCHVSFGSAYEPSIVDKIRTGQILSFI